ncbi:hypothetical protein GALL_480250 [mine drainage metagenome]|uniref:Uncharacterized protein n=1 Tax=mine drainage metagenome TaxID=410659 RepID=A0A1J5PS02_9ZZZZ
MCHVNDRHPGVGMGLLDAPTQLEFHLRVNHREWLIHQNGGYVVAHQAAPERDQLFFIDGQIAGWSPQS